MAPSAWLERLASLLAGSVWLASSSSDDLMKFCRELGALYIDTVVEPWPGFYFDKTRGNESRTKQSNGNEARGEIRPAKPRSQLPAHEPIPRKAGIPAKAGEGEVAEFHRRIVVSGLAPDRQALHAQFPAPRRHLGEGAGVEGIAFGALVAVPLAGELAPQHIRLRRQVRYVAVLQLGPQPLPEASVGRVLVDGADHQARSCVGNRAHGRCKRS